MIRVDLSRCTGCRRCEAACAFFHTGRINPELARLKVVHLYETGIDGPVVCQQCEERCLHLRPVRRRSQVCQGVHGKGYLVRGGRAALF